MLSLKQDLVGFFKLIRMLRKEQPHIIHCHSSLAGALGRIAGFICRIPGIIYTPHTMYYFWLRGMERVIFLTAEKLLSCITDRIITVSASEYHAVTNAFPWFQGVAQIENGVDVKYYQQLGNNSHQVKAALGIRKDTLIVLSLTRLDPPKDIWTFLKALALLPEDLPDYRVLIAGDGSEMRACQEYVASRGLNERVMFLGWRDDVMNLIGISDVMVLSSRIEGMPYSVLEGSAMGKAQIGSLTSGVKDGIVHGKTGFLFKVGDHESLAVYLERLLRDAPMRVTFGKNARKFVSERFNLRAMVKKTEAEYLGLRGSEVNPKAHKDP
jgi:glycosyltransferase involved in cell wall biosynthesis